MNDEKLNSEFIDMLYLFHQMNQINLGIHPIGVIKYNLGRKRPLPIGYSNKSIFLWQKSQFKFIYARLFYWNLKCIEDLQINLPEIQSKRDIQRKTFYQI